MGDRDIIAIGGSAGSTSVLKRLIPALPRDLPASVFITTHMPSTGHSHLAEMLADKSTLPVHPAADGQPIERGHVYVSVQDRHLLIVDGTIRLGAGPRENLTRPAIDPMFRSAALACGSRVIGVILSGLMNDGASGLEAIKQRGGLAVVQHPLEAEASDMPRAALETVDADHVARAGELPQLLAKLAGSPAPPGPPPTRDLVFEVRVALGARVGSEHLREVATPAALTCPDCGGVLSEVLSAGPLRYRCQIGHAYTAEVLAHQTEKLDEAIRIAMRVMEERVNLVTRMAQDARRTGRSAVAELYEQRAEEYARYAQTLREAALRTVDFEQGSEEEVVV